MHIRVKSTGVEWVVDDTSPTAKRVREQPDDYEILKTPEKSKRVKGAE